MKDTFGKGRIIVLIICAEDQKDFVSNYLKRIAEDFTNLQFIIRNYSDEDAGGDIVNDVIPVVIIDIVHKMDGYFGIGPRWMGILKKSIGEYQVYEGEVSPNLLENEYLNRHEISTVFVPRFDENGTNSLTKVFEYLNGR